MEKPLNEETITYRVDASDVIVAVCDNWRRVALAGGAEAIAEPQRVLGVSLFAFIDGLQTRYFYEVLLARVRDAGRTIHFPFRCDAPQMVRHLEMALVPEAGGRVAFHSRLVHAAFRRPVPLPTAGAGRPDTGGVLKVCSICKKILATGGGWVEIEEAVGRLRLFDGQKAPPAISHGVCPVCFASAMRQLDGP